jgi:hypothetical protein
MKFPKVVAAVAAMEKCQWKIGDALLEEIPVGQSGASNDAHDRLLECAEELEEQGLVIASATLRKYRLIASAFPAVRRRSAVSWTTHAEAGNPEMLDAILKIKKGKTHLPAREVRATKEVVQQHQAREHREEQRKAGVERKAPLKIPRGSKPTIRSEHLGGLRLLGEVLRHSGRLEDARDAIETATNFVRENLTKLDSEETELFTELAFEIAKKGHKLADVAQRLADRRKKHLSVVGG